MNLSFWVRTTMNALVWALAVLVLIYEGTVLK